MYTILITYYEKLNILKACLEQINQFYHENTNFNVLIVNDNDEVKLDTLISAKDFLFDLTIKNVNTNKGYGGAINYASKFISTEFIILMDSDIMVSSNWLNELYATYERFENVGCVGAKIYNMTDSTLLYYGLLNSDTEIIKPFLGSSIAHSYCEYDLECQLVPSGVLLIKKSLFVQVNCFDAEMYNAYLDLDLAMKLNALGYKNYVSTKCVVYHRGTVSGTIRHSFHAHAKALFFSKWTQQLENKGIDFFETQIKNLPQHISSDLMIFDFTNTPNSSLYISIIKKIMNNKSIKTTKMRHNKNGTLFINDYLSPDICRYQLPFIYLVNDFRVIKNNHFWFSNRNNNNDIVIDIHGNIVKNVNNKMKEICL